MVVGHGIMSLRRRNGRSTDKAGILIVHYIIFCIMLPEFEIRLGEIALRRSFGNLASHIRIAILPTNPVLLLYDTIGYEWTYMPEYR